MAMYSEGGKTNKQLFKKKTHEVNKLSELFFRGSTGQQKQSRGK